MVSESPEPSLESDMEHDGYSSAHHSEHGTLHSFVPRNFSPLCARRLFFYASARHSQSARLARPVPALHYPVEACERSADCETRRTGDPCSVSVSP